MTRLSGFVRTAPKLFYVIAVIDLLGNLLPLARLFGHENNVAIDYDFGMRLTLFMGLLKACVFAAQWIAYGVFATLLIALYDEVVALRAAAEDVPNA